MYSLLLWFKLEKYLYILKDKHISGILTRLCAFTSATILEELLSITDLSKNNANYRREYVFTLNSPTVKQATGTQLQ